MDNIQGKYSPTFDHTPYLQFPLPQTCEQLRNNGLSSDVAYWWEVMNGTATLKSRFFDEDDYYNSAFNFISGINQPIVIPAYSLTDLLALLPKGWMITHDAEGRYSLGMDKIWLVPCVEGKRLPDVVGMMIIFCIQKKILTAEDLNKKLTQLLPMRKVG